MEGKAEADVYYVGKEKNKLPSMPETVVAFFQEMGRQLVRESGDLTPEERKARTEEIMSFVEDNMGVSGGLLKMLGVPQFWAKGAKIARLKRELPAKSGLARAEQLNDIFATDLTIKKGVGELLNVAQSEFNRIKSVIPSKAREALGEFLPGFDAILLKPNQGAQISDTVWHEFTHARQFNPDISKGLKERDLMKELWELENRNKLRVQSPEAKYLNSPVEHHARMVGELITELPRNIRAKSFEENYLNILETALKNVR